MDYEWDPSKARTNLTKHGVPFEAVAAFDWERAIIWQDTRRNYGEKRWIAIAPIGARLHVLVFARQGGRVRVISLRKANRRERNAWHETPHR